VLDGQGAAGPPDALPVTLRAISPTGRPAPSSPTAWTRTAVGEVDHDPPPSRPPGPPDWPGACCLGVDAPPRPPVPLCVLAPADPAGLGWAGRVPVRVAVVCPAGLPVAPVGVDPVAALAVGGWAASQASTAAIASVCSWSRRRPASPPSSCTSMVNPGGPGRGRRGRRWPVAALRAAGVDPGGLGWGMSDSLLANGCWRRRPSSTAGGSGGSVAPESRSCFDHADQGVSASPSAGAADERAAPTTSQHRVRQAARRCTCSAPRPAIPPSGSRPDNLAGPGRPAYPGSRAPLQPPGSRRGDSASGSITGRSPTVHAVSGSCIRRSPAIRRNRSPPGQRRNTERPRRRWRAAAPIPSSQGSRLSRRNPTGSAASRTCEPDENTQRETVPQHPLRPDARPAAVPPPSDPQVTVAAPAGPAPPPATCGQPEARRASA
jgi:hypothetical protein